MVSYLWENLFRGNSHDQELTKILSENYLFKTLSKPEMSLLKDLVHVRSYKPGETIFTQGELGIGMYIVMKGTVNILIEDLHTLDESQRNVFITRLSASDFFGEISLVENSSRRTATATAADNVQLIGFFKPDLAEIVERNPRMSVKILTRLGEVLGRRLKETAERFTEVKRQIKELSPKDGST